MIITDGSLMGWLVKGNPSFQTPVRESTKQIPGRHGEWDYGSTLDSRKVTLDLVKEITSETRESTRRELFAAFPLSEVDLVFEGLTYKVILDGRIDIESYPGFLEASVPLRMVDPYAYGESHEITASGMIEYEGTAETYPVIEFTGPATNPSITIGDDTLVWTGSLLTGEKLTIDCLKRTVKKGTANAQKDYIGGFPSFSTDTEVLSTDSFKLTWADRY